MLFLAGTVNQLLSCFNLRGVHRIKDAGVNADFPEKFELEIPAAKFSNNLAVRLPSQRPTKAIALHTDA
jgi:hypothetical protein